MGDLRFRIYRYVSTVLIILGSAVFCLSSNACAGGVHFGIGVDASPGYAVAPPEVVYPPQFVERMPPPPPQVVERMPPPMPMVFDRMPPPMPLVVERPTPVVVERALPVVVHEEPVIVERHSTVTYYYPPAYEHRSYHVETEGGYYRERSYQSQDEVEY